MTQLEGHGGELVAATLGAFGVREIFTLSGGHIFSIYDGCVKDGIRIVDVRHEQTATFAAEGFAKLTRRPGVAVLTAGPGVTNGVSAITTAHFNGSPLVVLGGRAPQARWGAGSLQEFDHVPVVASITKAARTVTATGQIPKELHEAVTLALTPHRGPVFLDFPLDVVFASDASDVPEAVMPAGPEPDPDDVARAAALVAGAERPVLVAGGDVWADGAWDALRRCVESLRVPTFVNGQGRGCLPADHELAFARTRSFLKQADVVVVVGTPLDFRLSFGPSAPRRWCTSSTTPTVAPATSTRRCHPQATSRRSSTAWPPTPARGRITSPGSRSCATRRRRDVRPSEPELEADTDPIHPARVYGELRKRLARDAVVIGDGGDFVSYAGKLVDSYEPGCWMDPGPYGCLGTGLGYAIAARVAHPDRQVVLLQGDGAIGFNGMDFDSLVRHGLPVVAIVGNNGIWGLEKHPMQAIYGYDVAADLQAGCRYDRVVEGLGGAGETVEHPADLGPALDRAFAAGVPYLVNVLTDPAVAYPRSSNLA